MKNLFFEHHEYLSNISWLIDCGRYVLSSHVARSFNSTHDTDSIHGLIPSYSSLNTFSSSRLMPLATQSTIILCHHQCTYLYYIFICIHIEVDEQHKILILTTQSLSSGLSSCIIWRSYQLKAKMDGRDTSFLRPSKFQSELDLPKTDIRDEDGSIVSSVGGSSNQPCEQPSGPSTQGEETGEFLSLWIGDKANYT